MSEIDPETLPAECELALVHSPEVVREPLRIVFWLDARLARIVAGANETMLAQMRLAWWRDMFGTEQSDRPEGDVVLDGISSRLGGCEQELIAAVNGWERFLDEPPLTEEAAREFSAGRAAPFGALAAALGADDDRPAVESAMQRWSLVDAGLHVHSEEERSMLLSLAGAIDSSPLRNRSLRGLCVIDALTRRAIKRGGRPLMEGRAAALTAMRAATFGR